MTVQNIMDNMQPFLDKVDVKDSVVPSNEVGTSLEMNHQNIVTLLEKVKKELLDLIDYVTTVK